MLVGLCGFNFGSVSHLPIVLSKLLGMYLFVCDPPPLPLPQDFNAHIASCAKKIFSL